jgi:outer membrane lipoprotein-sorting protein
MRPKEKIMRRTSIVALIALALAPLRGWAEEPDFSKILAEIDGMASFQNVDFTANITVVSEKPGEDAGVLQARFFRRDRQDMSCIVILKPDAQKGQGYLLAEDNMWFYDPESRKFAHTSLKENFGDSKAKNSDLTGSSLAKDYRIEKTEKGKLGSFETYIIDLKAVNNEVPYPHMRIWIRQDNYLVLKAEDYSLSERLMRTAYYPHYVKIEDRYFPDKMLFVDELKKGEKTQMTFTEVSTAPLPDTVFTKTYLERVNR